MSVSTGMARSMRWSWRRHGILTMGGMLVGLVVARRSGGADLMLRIRPMSSTSHKCCRPPSLTHWLGTDEVGRDVLSRTIYAARISVEVALVAVGVGLSCGTLSACWQPISAELSIWRSCA